MGGDIHHLDLFIVEEPAVIGHHLRLGEKFITPLLRARKIDVTQGNDTVACLLIRTQVLLADPAAADQADAGIVSFGMGGLAVKGRASRPG
ncbi:MAG: hypothetical protein UZ16_OP3001001838 [Candidatus Hinthialibacteria bacterium OLB16]|nr:MAG: hypothetical protein UZ16_OP3001001838 [Candidatus Hinthialibacteria bacterium OLB16]